MGKSILFIIAILILQPVGQVWAFYGSIEASAGFDDNANTDYDAKKTGFSYFGAEAGKEFEVFSTAELDLHSGGSYQCRFSLDDAFNVNGGGSLSFTMAEGMVLSGIFAEGSIYRDGLNTEDEGKQIKGGARIDWIASGRLTLGTEIGASRFYYREVVETVKMVPGPPNRPPIHEIREVKRDDQGVYCQLQGVFHFSPNLKLSPGVEYENCSSSVKEESNNAFGFNISLFWAPDDLWETSAGYSWERVRYDFAPPKEGKRKETEQSVSFRISRFFGDFEIYLKGGWTKNDSTDEMLSYTQRIGQCGVVYTF